MNPSHILWSGQACPFKRAGVYYGLCEPGSLHDAARCLLPRRGVLYPVSSIRIRPEEPAPLVYLAVRDPSAVRVVPVTPTGRARARGGSIEDFAHVTLVFTNPSAGHPRGREPGAAEAESLAAARPPAPARQAGFVVTVGLRTELEAEFHERVVLAHHDRPYADLCERIMSVRDQFS